MKYLIAELYSNYINIITLLIKLRWVLFYLLVQTKVILFHYYS